MDQKELNDFASNNKTACLLLFQVGEDYAAARCCIRHALLAGLSLASQAVEKTLKAYLFFHDPKYAPKTHGHELIDLAKEVLKHYPHAIDLPSCEDTLAKLQEHYSARYPDSRPPRYSASTKELAAIDTIMIRLLENLPVPSEFKYRLGPYARFFDTPGSDPVGNWFVAKNEAFTDAIRGSRAKS